MRVEGLERLEGLGGLGLVAFRCGYGGMRFLQGIC
jgi:hypothetical protein